MLTTGVCSRIIDCVRFAAGLLVVLVIAVAGGGVAVALSARATASASCGAYRKAVKHTTDSAASQIGAKAVSTSIVSLNGISPPAHIHSDVARRSGKPESQLYRVGKTSKVFPLVTHHEADQDYHVVIADQAGATLPLSTGANPHRMVVEIVAPSCSTGSPLLDGIRTAQSSFAAYVKKCSLGTVKVGRSTWTKLSGTAVIEGVGFWDYPHALGHDTGIEIHPVTALSANC
jgi:hypothetical protein